MLCANLCFVESFLREKKKLKKSPFRPFTCHHQIAETATGIFFSPFFDMGMKYDLVFGYFGWIGIDLDVCFDVLGFLLWFVDFRF